MSTATLTHSGAWTTQARCLGMDPRLWYLPDGESTPNPDGNRFALLSARSFTALTATGGLTKAATRTLDFAIGSVVGGSAAGAGDTITDLRDQYLMSMSDVTWGVRR